jgi:hypothetical protein
MKFDWRTYWNRIKEVSKPLLHRLKTWGAVIWRQVMRLYNMYADWYMAQQEVIKKQSEVSHERITMKRAVLAFMETWGLGSRNIFYTMWHLIWRPGYMMSDYLNGHRKRYLQPFFMFFVLTLILVQMAWAIDVQLPKNRDMTLMAFDLLTAHSDWFSVEQMTKILKTAQWIDSVHDWRNENRSWDIIIHSIGICLIAWLLWRKTPRIGVGEWVVGSGTYVEGYNFAEIVTVIAYILCQLQMVSMVAMIFFHKLPFDHIRGFAIMPVLIIFGILLIDFKQLFQRKWWDTIWRTAVIVLFI